MAKNDEEIRLSPSGQDVSARRTLQDPHDLSTDVRSTVESQFRRMEQAHDRIRAEELAARLAGYH